MKLRYQLAEPKDLLVTVTITATVEEFDELAARVTDQWPGWKFRSALQEATTKARASFWGEPKDQES